MNVAQSKVCLFKLLQPRTFIAFPYKVAKSLSVEILRNVEYDAWLEVKKGGLSGMILFMFLILIYILFILLAARTYSCTHFDKNIPLPGDKCQVVSIPRS